ncbi:MAG: Fic family protein [Acidobacteria bacterium]|nr:Fic family protein [Acidobacteriota bacterium]
MPPVRYHASQFPPVELDWSRLIPLLGPTAAAIARYDGMLAAVPNADLLLSPLTTQEAVLSSRIEGTRATIGEVLEFEAGHESSPEKRQDIRGILNYRAALKEAVQLMQALPLCERVIRASHRVLLTGVRGDKTAPGEYRRIQNWIGPPGSTEETARYVPVAVGDIPSAMSAWERYANGDAPDRLVQLAALHAEFESIHPFLDGNGRIGRMLVPLFLWQVGLIRHPTFYISAYFEARRDAYYDGLLAVSKNHDWTGWCRFFLQAVQAQAEENLSRTRAILGLHEDMKRRLPEMTRSQHAMKALDWVFWRPTFRTADFVAQSGIPAATAKRFLKLLKEAGVLKTVIEGGGRRPPVVAFAALLNMAEGHDYREAHLLAANPFAAHKSRKTEQQP